MPDRLDEDHNAFFESALAHDENQSIHQSIDVINNTEPTQIDSTIAEYFRSISTKINAIEDFLIKLMVKVDDIATKSPFEYAKQKKEVDKSALIQFKLPAESVSDLDHVEQLLKENGTSKEELVSIFSNDNAHTYRVIYVQLH